MVFCCQKGFGRYQINLPDETFMGPCEAPEGTNTKVASARGHFCAYLNKEGRLRKWLRCGWIRRCP